MEHIAALELKRLNLQMVVSLFEAVARNDMVAAEQLISRANAEQFHERKNSLLAMAERLDNTEMLVLLKRCFAN